MNEAVVVQGQNRANLNTKISSPLTLNDVIDGLFFVFIFVFAPPQAGALEF